MISAAGAVLVLLALRDIFHTLWHPSGRGTLSRLTGSAVWWLSRRVDRRDRQASLAGPTVMASVIAVWGVLVVAGWAIIYYPHLPEAFVYSTGLRPDRRSALLDAFYLSLVTVATLGFGDIVPSDGWLRLAVPLEALVGFAVVTASVSWVLQIYPALTRRRALAIRLALLRRASHPVHDLDRHPAIAAQVLESFSGELVGVRVDLSQYAVTYYFQDNDEARSLPAMAKYAVELAELGTTSRHAEVRLAAGMLTAALDDLAALIDEQFLHTGAPTGEVLRAYARDHHPQRT